MRVLLVLLVLTLAISPSQAKLRNIIPFPSEITQNEGSFLITNNLPVTINNGQSVLAMAAIKRLQEGFAYRTSQTFFNQPIIGKSGLKGVNIAFKTSRKPGLDVDESYELNVNEESITLTSATDIGVLRGVETLLQLVEQRDSTFHIPCVHVKDSPRFQWRGLLMDVSRHFMPVDVIKRNMEAMASVKLNVLHLHLCDDQGWRIESKIYPSLHIMASDGDYYTQAQIRDLVQFASLKGITIVPEIDIPGHATAILSAMPELASKKEVNRPATRFGVLDPVLDPTNEKTYEFLSNVFRELNDLFPGEYLHIGGDEVKPDHWNANPKIKSFMASHNFDAHAMQNYLIQRVTDSLQLFNRKTIGWDEVFTDKLPKETMVHCWRNKNVCYQAARNGYKTIVSHGFYLDLLYPAKTHYVNEIIEQGANLDADQLKNVLGGEACMWSELVDERTMDSRLWPRLGAVAENLWSQQNALNKKDLQKRLAHLSLSLNEFKLTHQSAGYAIMLEIAKNGNILPLVELQGICEPVTGYQRHNDYPYATSTPLNAFADAVIADAPLVDPFRIAVDEFIVAGKNPENFDYITEKLYDWKGFYEYYADYFQSNPDLQKLIPLAQNLSKVAALADEAMEATVKGRVPKSAWIESAKTTIKEAKQPVQGVKLAIIDDLERLFSFAKDHDVIEF